MILLKGNINVENIFIPFWFLRSDKQLLIFYRRVYKGLHDTLTYKDEQYLQKIFQVFFDLLSVFTLYIICTKKRLKTLHDVPWLPQYNFFPQKLSHVGTESKQLVRFSSPSNSMISTFWQGHVFTCSGSKGHSAQSPRWQGCSHKWFPHDNTLNIIIMKRDTVFTCKSCETTESIN